MKISLLVAVDNNNAIGLNNTLPWHLPADLKRFKQLTQGKAVIMGRKTYESIIESNHNTLPGRKTIVLTNNPYYVCPPYIITCQSIGRAIYEAGQLNMEEVFIIGGAEIFKQTLSLAEKIYFTVIEDTFEADAYFPKVNDEEWNITGNETFMADEKNKYNYKYLTLERKKPEVPEVK
ncbi:MAG: dihydrofolate reductase [Bacteroidota bacterium]|nr:dihydrofolate reductase [Bacteroidota bacterium]